MYPLWFDPNEICFFIFKFFITYVCRQRSYDSNISARMTQLVSLNRTLVPDIDELLKDSVSRPYERSTTPTGVPYYIK